MTHRPATWALIGIVFPLMQSVAREQLPEPLRAEVFVSPTALEGGDGRRARPLRSLEEARDALRARPMPAERVNELLGGTWERSVSFELDSRDSGLVVRAAEGTGARLVGGVVLHGEARAVNDGPLLARLPSLALRTFRSAKGQAARRKAVRRQSRCGMGTPLIHITGAHDMRLEGIVLEGARGTALVIEDCTNVKVQGCSITNVGNHGIVVTGSSNTIKDCKITGTGVTGVSLLGGDRQDLTHGNNCLKTTQINRFGRLFRTYQPAVKVDGVGQIVRGNKLAHAPHSAIIFSGNEHQIEDNEIFDVLRETGDSGAIDCGRDWAMHGTRIVGNFIHDLGGTDGRWQNAIYLDHMASGIEVADNTIWRCHWGMPIGGGRDLWIHNNTFIECKLGIRFDARCVGWMAKNIADPATSTLHQRLAALPIGAEPWASRYPSLAHYLDDRFGRPAGSRGLDNRFFDTPFGSVVDTECVEVRGSVESEGLPADFEANGIGKDDAR